MQYILVMEEITFGIGIVEVQSLAYQLTEANKCQHPLSRQCLSGHVLG